jgi:hypothetical protein
MGITVMEKEDGFWLHFTSPEGNHALVSVDKLLTKTKGDGIINKAVTETCRAMVAAAPASEVLLKVVTEMDKILANIRHVQLVYVQRSLVEWAKAIRGLIN